MSHGCCQYMHVSRARVGARARTCLFSVLLGSLSRQLSLPSPHQSVCLCLHPSLEADLSSLYDSEGLFLEGVCVSTERYHVRLLTSLVHGGYLINDTFFEHFYI